MCIIISPSWYTVISFQNRKRLIKTGRMIRLWKISVRRWLSILCPFIRSWKEIYFLHSRTMQVLWPLMRRWMPAIWLQQPHSLVPPRRKNCWRQMPKKCWHWWTAALLVVRSLSRQILLLICWNVHRYIWTTIRQEMQCSIMMLIIRLWTDRSMTFSIIIVSRLRWKPVNISVHWMISWKRLNWAPKIWLIGQNMQWLICV